MRFSNWCLALALTLAQLFSTSHAVEQAAPSIPADVLRFGQEFNAAMTSGDFDRVAPFFSRRYLHDGRRIDAHRQHLAMLMMNVSRYRLRLTSYQPISKNRAYISAEVEASWGDYDKKPDYQIVREKGRWRWLGNQKAAANP